jgi:hypothetical protein
MQAMSTSSSTGSSTTGSSTAGNTTPPTPAQISQTTAAALAAADTGSAQTLLNLKMVQQARLSQLKRTAATLKKQYGPDDPSVKAAESAVNLGAAKVARIAAAHQELDTPAPQAAVDGWVLHGRVYNSDLKPHAKYTVFLVDSQKTYQEAYGFTYTDDTGYFLFNVAATESNATSTLFIAMTNTKGEPIYLGTTPFEPAPGSVTYQNITIPTGTQPLGDPPTDIRDVALPSRKKKTTTKAK